jgi:LuxR family transcriptional regulator, maltose regulon positive regulatory protein
MTGLDSVECRQILDQLRQRNLFVVVLDREGTWFRYHRQFRAMLINRAGALLSAQTLDAIRREAVAWLAAHGWTEEAFAESVAQGYWATAADLVESDRHRLQNRQDWHLLWRRLNQLPDELVAKRPGLLLAKAWILMVHGRYAAIIPLLERAASVLATVPAVARVEDVQALHVEIDTLRAAWFFVEVPVNLRISRAQAAVQKLVPATRYEWVRGFAYISLVHSMLATGQRNTAYRQVLQEIDAVDLGSVRYIARLHQPLGTLDYLDGSLVELRQTTTHYLQLAIQAEMPMAAAWARFGIGWSYFQQGESQLAFDNLLPLFDRAREIHMLTAMLAMPVLVAAAADLGHADVVHSILEQMQRVAVERENFAAVGEFQAAAAYGALLRRNHQAALEWAVEFARMMAEPAAVANLPLQSAQVLIYGKIILVAGTMSQLRDALATLHSYVDTVTGRGYQVEVIQGTVLLACCYWRSNQPVRATHWMQRALELGLPRGFRRAFFDQGDDLAAILDAMMRRNICTAEASGLLAEYGAWRAARQGRAPAQRAAAPDAVRVLTEREEEILALLAERRSNNEIARQLAIAPQTVRNHTNNIYRKLEVSSRKQAVALARELRLLPPP